MVGSAPLFAAEMGRPMDREGDKSRSLLLAGKFAELEALERATRDLSMTISDGQQARAAFYAGIHCGCSRASHEEKAKELDILKGRVEEWRKAYPDSIAAKLAQAGYYRSVAWMARGESYARDVPAEAWPVYKENIRKATQLLDAMGPEAKAEPEWYADRLEISMDGSEPRVQFKALLAESLKRHPRYLPIYFMGARGHSPQWGGSNAELNAFIDDAVKRTKDWLGDTLYARLQWGNWRNDMFENGQADWSRFQPAMEHLLVDYPDNWTLNDYGKFACLSRDMTATLDAVERIGSNVNIDAWGGMGYYARCKEMAERISRMTGVSPAKRP